MSTKKKNLSLGEFLKAHRLGEGESQTAFSKMLGVSKQRLSDLEADRGNVSIKLCKSIAKRLGLPAEWLVRLSLQHQLKKEGLDLKVS